MWIIGHLNSVECQTVLGTIKCKLLNIALDNLSAACIVIHLITVPCPILTVILHKAKGQRYDSYID